MALEFPVHDKDDYKGRITFEAVQEQWDDTLAESGWSLISDLNDQPEGAVAPGSQGDGLRGTQQTTRAPIATVVSKGSVQLYLPAAINFADAAEYTNVDLGTIGGAAAGAIRAGKGLGTAIAQGMSDAIPDVGAVSEALRNGVGPGASLAAKIAASRMARFGGQGVAGAVETETGIILNPNRRTTFRGVGIRRFRFAFQMIPTSHEEAEKIKDIIYFFRKEMYPEEVGGLGAGTGLSVALKFPSKFKIRLSYNGNRIGTGILPCFLEGVDVQYNPNAMAFHSDGNPQETVVTLSFLEERAMTRKDIQR